MGRLKAHMRMRVYKEGEEANAFGQKSIKRFLLKIKTTNSSILCVVSKVANVVFIWPYRRFKMIFDTKSSEFTISLIKSFNQIYNLLNNSVSNVYNPLSKSAS